MDAEQLKAILARHDKWTRGDVDGERANLDGAVRSAIRCQADPVPDSGRRREELTFYERIRRC